MSSPFECLVLPLIPEGRDTTWICADGLPSYYNFRLEVPGLINIDKLRQNKNAGQIWVNSEKKNLSVFLLFVEENVSVQGLSTDFGYRFLRIPENIEVYIIAYENVDGNFVNGVIQKIYTSTRKVDLKELTKIQVSVFRRMVNELE